MWFNHISLIWFNHISINTYNKHNKHSLFDPVSSNMYHIVFLFYVFVISSIDVNGRWYMIKTEGNLFAYVYLKLCKIPSLS